MGWFSKNKKEEAPSLPELPKLPEMPKLNSGKLENPPIHQLPSFPASSIGEKFSQDTIKKAVTGKKEDNWGSQANDFDEDEQMMPEPKEQFIPKKIKVTPFTRNVSSMPESFKEPEITKKAEPVFVRIDKFEESLKIFEETKNKVLEIEKILKEIKEIKEKEESELHAWENEISRMKDQISRIDKNIFSKIE